MQKAATLIEQAEAVTSIDPNDAEIVGHCKELNHNWFCFCFCSLFKLPFLLFGACVGVHHGELVSGISCQIEDRNDLRASVRLRA